jgi:hypothetical protein
MNLIKYFAMFDPNIYLNIFALVIQVAAKFTHVRSLIPSSQLHV